MSYWNVFWPLWVVFLLPAYFITGNDPDFGTELPRWSRWFVMVVAAAGQAAILALLIYYLLIPVIQEVVR